MKDTLQSKEDQYPEWVTSCEQDDAIIIMDIADTQREIDQYQRELEAFAGDKQKNRTAIYLAEGNITKREEFIKQLRLILEYRTTL